MNAQTRRVYAFQPLLQPLNILAALNVVLVLNVVRLLAGL